jgi:hypothetical protein
MKFTEAQLESAIIELLGAEDYPHVLSEAIKRHTKEIFAIPRDALLPRFISGEPGCPKTNHNQSI